MLLNRRYNRFTFVENTTSNLPKVTRAKFLRSDGLFCFISICRLGGSKNPFVTITSLSEFCFRFRRFIVGTDEKSGFYKLWQQYKQLKTVQMSEA